MDYEFRVFFDAIFCICNRICSCWRISDLYFRMEVMKPLFILMLFIERIGLLVVVWKRKNVKEFLKPTNFLCSRLLYINGEEKGGKCGSKNNISTFGICDVILNCPVGNKCCIKQRNCTILAKHRRRFLKNRVSWWRLWIRRGSCNGASHREQNQSWCLCL